MEFVGREEQLQQLMSLWRKGTSSMVTCQGRRRIGKSRLIDEFAARSGCRYLKISGLAPRRNMANRDQLRYFCDVLSERTGMVGLSALNWIEAFRHLGRAISENGEGRIVVLLDEISWMGAYDVDFPGYLKDAWDDDFKKNPILYSSFAAPSHRGYSATSLTARGLSVGYRLNSRFRNCRWRIA